MILLQNFSLREASRYLMQIAKKQPVANQWEAQCNDAIEVDARQHNGAADGTDDVDGVVHLAHALPSGDQLAVYLHPLRSFDR